MASEYLLKKAREQAPAEAPRELTPAEKRKNWWHYHKWWVIVGIVLVWIVGSMLWNVLGIGKVKPDYIFAYVGTRALDKDLAAGLEKQLAELGGDRTGDGKVRVELRQYVMAQSTDNETAYYYQYAADTQLLADVTKGESYFFLTNDPEGVQRAYQLLANSDGTPPDERDYEIGDKVFAWGNCPVLAGLDVDQTALSGLYLGRRCFYGEAAEGREPDDAFWQIITKGANR